MQLIDVEADTLGQRKFSAKIDRTGDTAHVAFPHVRASLASASRFLFAAERAMPISAPDEILMLTLAIPTIRTFC